MRIATKLVLGVLLLFAVTTAYAGNGDLIVDGKLGVGTDIPQSSLHIYTPSANATPLIISDASGYTANNGPALLFRRGFSAEDFASIRGVFNQTMQGNYADLVFGTRTSDALGVQEKMRILYNGNVGIGTQTPSHKLHVAGHSRMHNTTVGHSGGHYDEIGYNVGYTTTNDTYTYLFTDSAASIRLGYGNPGSGMEFRVAPFGNSGTPLTLTTKMKLNDSGLTVNGNLWAAGQQLASDQVFKKNVQPVEGPLTKVQQLSGVSYEWKADEHKDKGFPTGRHYGVIAQEIEKVLPEVVSTAADGTKSVAYTEIIPVLIEAIKEQQRQINELKSLVNSLRQ